MGKIYNVLPEWFKKTDALGFKISSWCRQSDDRTVYCIICKKDIHCYSKGFAALTQHVGTGLHGENAAVKLHSSQLQLKGESSKNSQDEPPPQLTVVYNKEAVAKAEILWALKSVKCNMAASVSDDLKELFSVMFPSAPEAESFQLGRTKLSYLITEALGPYFRKKLMKEIENCYFTLLFDETTNNAEKKELQFRVRFWSEDLKEITCRHLQTVFIGHATANDIVKQIETVLTNGNLSLDKLLMLGSDGPNVNKKVSNIVNKQVLDVRDVGLIDIGTCNLHVIHNAFLKGLQEFGDSASELITDLYHYFKKFPSRWEDFESIQKKKNISNRRFLKHSGNRWLTIGPACERILDQWQAIVHYFTIFLPKNDEKTLKTEKYKRILKILKYKDILVELMFVSESAVLYSSFNEFFQNSNPQIHVLSSEINDLLIKVSGRICKVDATITDKISTEHLKKASEVDCASTTKAEIEKLKTSEQEACFYKMQRHYMASYNYIKSKNILSNGMLKDLGCLAEDEISSADSVAAIGRIANSLSFLGVKELDVKDEWRVLQCDMSSSNNAELEIPSSPKRIDHFWRDIIYQKSSLGALKYPSLHKLIKACLSLSHGNSDVERGFSVSKRILAEDKALMSERVLNDRLTIRDSLKPYSTVAEFKVDKDLLSLAYCARKSYERYLEDQKKLKEAEKRIAEEKENKAKEEKLNEEKIAVLQQSVAKLENKALLVNQEKNEIKETADKLSEEANERLKKALKANDMQGIRLAQGMIEGSLQLRQKEKEHEANEQKLNRIVNKRKQSLMESFMLKKPKI